ncbi:hypothetical protein SNE40_000435 [Patella caerulea]|uniref:Protein transport protein sec16 n=1 Tax=Patella caerulea TaxID=87958 RepID=A0AAN8KDV0_PATCE
MSQSAPWNVHNSQPVGGVKMFDPTQFSGAVSTSAANVPYSTAATQQAFIPNSAGGHQESYNPNSVPNQQQGYAPHSVENSSYAQPGDPPQNFQNHENSWNSWSSWGAQDNSSSIATSQQQNVHTPGEASGIYSPQSGEYGQGYWDPRNPQNAQYVQNIGTHQQMPVSGNPVEQQQQWQGYTQDQGYNVQTSQQPNMAYNTFQPVSNDNINNISNDPPGQLQINSEQSGHFQNPVNFHPPSNEVPTVTHNTHDINQVPTVTHNTHDINQSHSTNQSHDIHVNQSHDISQSHDINQSHVADSNMYNTNAYFNNSADHQTVPFSTGQVSGEIQNQFLDIPDNIHRTDSLISNSSLVTRDSSNNSMDQDELLQQMAGQFQNVSLDQSEGQEPIHQPIPVVTGDARSGQNPTEEEHQSPLNDWEFVGSVPSSSSQHSRQSSLENSVNFLTSQPAQPGSQVSNQPQGTETVDPYNVKLSASFNSESSSSAYTSSVSATSSSVATSGTASLSASLNSPPGSLNPPPPPAQASSNKPASSPNPFRRQSPSRSPVPQKDTSNNPVVSAPIFHPIQLQSPTATASQNPDLSHPVSLADNQLPFQSAQSSKNESADNAMINQPKTVSDNTVTSKRPETMELKSSPSKQPPSSEKTKDQDATDIRPFVIDSSKPPTNPMRDAQHSSPRKHSSAFKPVARAKHNMSPATTLWDDVVTPALGIHLAPAAPSVTEASQIAPISKSRSASPIEKTSSRSSRQDERRNEYKGSDSEAVSDSSRSKYRERRLGSNSWKKDDDNRSLDSLDEVNSKMDSYKDKRYKDRYAARDPYYEKERPSSRYDRERPSSRNDYRDDYRSRYRGHYRAYEQDPYYQHERYERPRSRNNESDQVGQSGDRPKSRADTERDLRDAYYRERYRGYDYDPRRRYYYDEHQRSNYDLDYLYTQGYYDEYYSGQARYADYYRQYGGDTDQYSQRSYSPRGNNLAIDDADQSYDSQGRLSRPSSRQDDQYGYDAYDSRHGYYYGHDYYGQGYYDPYASYQDSSYQRLTPHKYTIPHMKACFGANGQLIKVLPNRPADGQPAVVEVHEIESVLADVKGAEEVKEFPGPLVRGDTHKNDVLLFCQRKAKMCNEDINMVDRESAELTWRLLEVLIKQNGTVIGTDIADLLLEGHEPSTHEYSMSGVKIATSLENLDRSTPDEPEEKVTSDRTVINKGKSRDDVIDRFRHLLLYGRKKDALEWAMKNNIWGHALFLASKMDTRTHANVMTKFANGAMKMNDPLQTLYQLMSGRQPAAVTCMSDERWGDWRPHLAIILSNHTSKTDIDRKSIATLGDTLAAKGCLNASHFCYIMAQTQFGTFTKKTSKIVLIGSSHNLSLKEFATNQAIQCTEIYEYAQSLGNASFVLPHLQVFKFLYACRLAEYGFSQEALHYCEVISRNVQRSPAYYQPPFVKSLYQLADRLKYCDPSRQHGAEDMADPDWLHHLSVVCQGYDDGSIQPISGTATPAGFGGTTNSSDSGEVAEYTSNTPSFGAAPYQNYSHQEGSTYTDPNYQQQYNQGQYDQSQGYYQQVQGQYQPDKGYYQQGQYQQGQGQYQQGQGQYQQTETSNQVQTDQPTTEDKVDTTSADYLEQLQAYNQDWNQYNQQQGYVADPNHQQPTDAANTIQANNYNTANQNTAYGQQGYYQQTGVEGQQGFYNQARNSIASTQSQPTEEDEEDDDDEDGEEVDSLAPQTSSFDYFNAATVQKIVAPPSRIRTNSNSSTGIPPRQRTTSGSSTGSISAANPKPKSTQDKKKQEPKQGENGGGGGWLNMFGWRKKPKGKEMKLPDDKDPQIVWDPVNKKWFNPNAEESSAPAAPPPKDTDLMGKSSGMNGSAPPMMAGSGGPNRFSLKSAGGARNQYVDVLNPKSSPSPLPTALLNTVPQTSANTNIYNPLSASGQASSVGGNKLNVPQQSQTEQTSNQNAGPPGMPVMFDPTQFQQTTQPQAETKQKGMKYGQRRKYPK